MPRDGKNALSYIPSSLKLLCATFLLIFPADATWTVLQSTHHIRPIKWRPMRRADTLVLHKVREISKRAQTPHPQLAQRKTRTLLHTPAVSPRQSQHRSTRGQDKFTGTLQRGTMDKFYTKPPFCIISPI